MNHSIVNYDKVDYIIGIVIRTIAGSYSFLPSHYQHITIPLMEN